MKILSHAIESELKTVAESPHQIDVLIIGSGTAGITTAIELAKSGLGLRIVVLEAGPLTVLEHMGSSPLCVNQEIVPKILNQVIFSTSWITEQEYLQKEDKTLLPHNNVGFSVVGGRTIFWAGLAPRFIPSDFKDWPFSYEEFLPYYHQAENLMRTSPRLPEAPVFFQSKGQKNLISRLRRKGFYASEASLAVDTTTTLNGNIPRGFDSSIGRLLRSGYLVKFGDQVGISLVAEAEAVFLEKKGEQVEAVHVMDRRHELQYVLAPKHVVLAGGGLQSVRLAMVSEVDNKPDILGRYINDHIFIQGLFRIRGEKEVDPLYIFIPSTAEQQFQYQIQGPFHETWYNPNFATVWLDWQKGGRYLLFYCFGIGSMEKNNRLVLNKRADSSFGLLSNYSVIYDRSPQDIALIKQMHQATDEVASALGADIIKYELNPPGSALHEIGGLRMGKNPQTSILDPSGQFWRVRNLSVADSSAWPSQGAANSYLSITAWSLKHAEDLIKRLKQ